MSAATATIAITTEHKATSNEHGLHHLMWAVSFPSMAQSVCDHGVDTMLGLMGNANLFMVDHYVRSCKGTLQIDGIWHSVVIKVIAGGEQVFLTSLHRMQEIGVARKFDWDE